MKKIFYTALLVCLCHLSWAQVPMWGLVSDEQGQALVGATIVLKETGRVTTSDATGRFAFPGLQPGAYTLEVSFIGYERMRVPVNVGDSRPSQVRINMKPGRIELSDVVVSASTDRPVNSLSPVDMSFRPINTAQDILRMVPGLFIAQHAGGGKAEQIFLRGFDCDHGTDINIEVDGMPVNMVSHAHGQGYADLHFLMPELISVVDFDKGPYFANKGDLNTAGYVAFQTRNRLEHNFIKLETGSFNTQRVAAGVNITDTKKTVAYIASEYFHSDGFFDNKQNFGRFNAQAKVQTRISDNTTLNGMFTAFSSQWNASGQIPDRAVDEGIISRYGSIDPTEGGNTSRYNMNLKLSKAFSNGATWENQAYAIRYNFNLFSNFTFYLKDSVNGDQINQRDSRWIYGYKSSYQRAGTLFGKSLNSEDGAGLRYDVIDELALDHTVRRAFLNHIKYGSARELNVNAYLSENLTLSDRFSIGAGLRLDYLHFQYDDRLSSVQQASVGKAIVNPKFSMTYHPARTMSLFFRAGTGFHSNDARVVVQQDGKDILPRAYSADLGFELKPTQRLFLHAALWQLDLDQEFVYVGDEGIVEPSGRTRRIGVDASVRYQLADWLFADIDFNFTRPRSKDAPEGENYIPLAPLISSIGGLTVKRSQGFGGSLRYRYLGDRPANEDNTVVARGYFITDAILNYSRKTYEIGLSLENVFDVQWKEAQFDTESRLRNEPAPAEEIHFTPGTPFAMKLRFTKTF
ncbi:MAG TPA: TonB-dependent receptor [Cyclobacteriaceae bacterium]|nr:TonB-dependent receptor [Cyclobacteriaceae bacterium]